MMLAPLPGLPEIAAGDDLVSLIAAAMPLLSWPDGSTGVTVGDILVVTSKIVAKAEGRARPAAEREAAITSESLAEVARVAGAPGQPDTRVVRTHQGLVLAAAGIDASNVADGTVLLLPRDPDASAARLHRGLVAALGCSVGIVVSDTAGRPWRMGQVDLAIGVAGLEPLIDLRGSIDHNGRQLHVTVRAIADEIASAAELVGGKDRRVPVVAVRGLADHVLAQSGPGAMALVRPVDQDAFRLGTAEALAEGEAQGQARGEARGRARGEALGRAARLDDLLAGRRTIRRFGDAPVPAEAIRAAAAAAATAPAPHHSQPWLFVHMADRARRVELLAAMAAQWAADLRADGFADDAIQRRLRRGDVLREAPEVVAAFMRTDGAHDYPDQRRRRAEREMFVAAGGGALSLFLLRLSTEGLGAAWISSSIFCPEVVVAGLGLTPDHVPLGMVAIGWPDACPPGPRPPRPAPLITI